MIGPQKYHAMHAQELLQHLCQQWALRGKYIDTTQSTKRNNIKTQITITWNKETQMTTGQHEPLWKPEMKSGAPEG